MTRLLPLLRRYLVSDAPPLSPAERLRSTLAGLFGLLLFEGVLFVLPLSADEKHVLAPLGATSVILFALPHSPLAQPWSVIGGLLLAAPLGYACGLWLPPGPWVLAIALAASLWLTAWARCIHPPAGAMALTMALAATQGLPFEASMWSAAANTLAIMVAVMVVNNLVPGRHYPQGTPPAVQKQQKYTVQPVLAHRDLAAALDEIDSFLDVREDDLIDLYERTLRNAYRRTTHLRCIELIGTEAPPAIEFATPLSDAWLLMRRERLDALPVIDRSRRVIGMLALEDFLDAVTPDSGQRLGDSVKRLLARTPESHSDKAEVAGQMMRETRHGLNVARLEDGIADVAEMLGNGHQAAVPVVDASGRLAGLLNRRDVLAALYHRSQLAGAQAENAPEGAPA